MKRKNNDSICKILKVIDGDTVDVDIDLGFGVWMHKERVRVYGIDNSNRTRDKVAITFMQRKLLKDFYQVLTQTLCTQRCNRKFGRILGKFEIYDSKTDLQIYDDG